MVDQILQVVTDTDRRGAQVFATDLHAAFERAGRSVRTVALAPGATGGLDLPVLGRSRKGLSTLRALRTELRGATIAIAHGSTTLPACAVTSFAAGTPFVYRQISDSRFWAPSGLRRQRVRMALRRAAGVVALWSGSATTVHEHLGVPRSKIHVIPNGVPAERFGPVTADERAEQRRVYGLDASLPTVLSVSALAPEKGVDLVIDALGELSDVQLLVVGDGPARPELEARAERVARGRVVFAGSVPDILGVYAVADVFVLASRGGDSMPAVLIEAGLRGLPAISTDVEAIPEVVVDGVTGRIVARDSRPALTAAIREIVTDADRGSAFGAAARAHCLEHFDMDAVAARWLRELDDVRP